MAKSKVDIVAKQQDIESIPDELVYDCVKSDIDSVKDWFLDAIEYGNICADFYEGNQWDAEELNAHKEQNRYPFVLNEILPVVDHLIGTQQSTRMDSRVVGREKGDEIASQLLTFLNKWADQLNQLEYIETEVFKSGLIRGVGVAAVYWDFDNILFGYPKVEYMPSKEFFWDRNSIQQNLSDARWMARVTYKTRLDLRERYPEFANEINNASVGDSMVGADSYSAGSRYRVNTQAQSMWKDRELVEHVEHFERIKTHVYTVVDDIAGTNTVYDNSVEAKAYYKGLIQGYTANNINVFNDDFSAKVVFVTTSTDKIMYSVLIGKVVVCRMLTSLSQFPYEVFFAYYNEGRYWGFIKNLLSPQIGINRAYSQWDYALGAAQKNPVTVMESMLRKGWTVEMVRKEGSRTSPYIPVLDHNAIRTLPNQPANPQLFDVVNFNISRIVDYSGGKNVRGFTESAAESGTAVVARAEQGGVSKLPLFDSLRRWRKGITERVVWYMKNYMNTQQILRIIGSDPDVQYIPIDDGVLDTLSEMKTDITIDEAVKSETMKERHFQQVMQFAQIAQLPQEVISEFLLEFSSLPNSKKEEIKANLTAWKAKQQEEMELAKQQKMTMEVTDSLTKKKMKEQMDVENGVSKTQEDLEIQAKSIETQRKNLLAKAEELKNQAQQ